VTITTKPFTIAAPEGNERVTAGGTASPLAGRLELPKVPVKPQMLRVQIVSSNNRQPSRHTYQIQAICDCKGTIIEQHMMVWAETQQVRQVIGAVVGSS
jgi:hypothetical protein